MASGLSILNENPQILPGPSFLHQLIPWDQRQIACALDFLSEDGRRSRYSYQDLRRHVTSFAMRIQANLDGLETQYGSKQPIVPVLVPQSPALYIAILAILEVGAAFCPINLDAPVDRIKFITADVSSHLIITTSAYEDTVKWDHGPNVLLVEEFPTDFHEISRKRILHFQTSPLAYVMYTSGSTGTPKGVAISHLAASQSLLAHDRHLPTFKRFLQFASPSFDVSVFEIFFPLFRGSTLVGCNRAKMLNDLPGTISNLEVDAAELTPTVAGALVQTRSKVPTLKLLLTIGEMLTRHVVDSFGTSESSEGILYGMYGPTEAAIHCTINSKMKFGAKVGNIGVPLDTVSTFIMSIEGTVGDHSSTILPVGEVGELVLGGPQLAEGYLHREDQNAAAFLQIQGKLAYRTGDKARMLAEGTIEVLGRISSGQVKLRGQRVELGEIEEVVYKYPGVRTAFANVINGTLIVFALRDSLKSNVQGIFEVCEKWLPKFMVPNEIVLLDDFPYLPSGKINRKELESQYLQRRSEEEEDQWQTQSTTERKIVDVIQELLGAKGGVKRKLRGCGVDSLVAIRLAPALRSHGFYVSPVEILRAETLELLAKICDDSRKTVNGYTSQMEIDYKFTNLRNSTTNALENVDDIEDILPCTPTQDAMLSETFRNGNAYKNYFQICLPGCQSANTAIASIEKLIQHNSVLRTGFVEFPNPYSTHAQVVLRRIPKSQIQVVKTFTYEATQLRTFSTRHPLNVQLRPYEGSITLLFHIHHALYDAWSLELLLDDLNHIIGEQNLLPRPLFRSFVHHQVKIRADSDLWSSQEYWRDYLAQAIPCGLPNFTTVVDIVPGLQVSSLQTSISVSELDLVARALNVSPHSLFQSAFSILLSSYLGQRDICFGTVFSGRTTLIDEIDQIVGPCLSTLPVRVDLNTIPSVEYLVQHLNATNLKHLEHENLPLRDVKKCAGVDPGRHLFDTLIIWQQTFHETNQKRENVDFISSTDYLEFSLTLEVTPGHDTVQFKANYEQALFPQAQIRLLLRQLERLVLSFIDSTQVSLSRATDSLTADLLSIELEMPTAELKQALSTAVDRIAVGNPNYDVADFINTIGLPSKNTSVFVLGDDGDFNLLPRGAEGEFCFGCVQIEERFLTVEQETGKYFDHPEHGRIYRSGYCGRLLADESLVFTRKKDDQVNSKLLNAEHLDPAARQQSLVANCSWTKVEKSIAKALSVVTKVPENSIQPQTSFFRLGIDSLTAITLSRILREESGLKVDISEILKYSSISRLAAQMAQMTSSLSVGPESSLVPKFTFDPDFLQLISMRFAKIGKIIERITPCTPLQDAMLTAAENSTSHLYENNILLDIYVDSSVVQLAWSQMVQRHEILRTCFAATTHSRFAYAQVVLKEHRYDTEIIESDENNILSLTEDLRPKERGPSGLEPPYSLTFINSSRESRLLLSMHHALYDGYAMSIIFEEMELALRNYALPSPVSFLPFINYMASLDFRKADEHWRVLLKDYVHIPLATKEIEAKNGDNERIKTRRLTSDCNLSWIEDQVKLHQTSLLAVCQAAWASALAEYTELPDLCFGNVVSGRTVPVERVDRLVAPCFNTIPVRVKNMHKVSFLEVFRILQSQNVDAIPFQLTPLRRVQSQWSSEGRRLFDTLIILQPPVRELDCSIWSIREESGAMDLPIVVEIVPHPEKDAMELVLYSHDSVCLGSEASQLLKNVDLILKKALQNPRNQALSPSSKALCAAHLARRGLQSTASLINSLEDTSLLTKLELDVRNVISDFTDVPLQKIGRLLSIYRLGLDSISAVQVATALRAKGYKLVAGDVLQHPNIKDLAAYLETNRDTPSDKVRTFNIEAFDKLHRETLCQNFHIAGDDIQAIRPCTPVQCGMLAQTVHSGGSEYLNSFRMKLEPGVSLAKLRQAWSSVMRAHEMLRTGFVEFDDPKHQFAMICFHPGRMPLPWTESLSQKNSGNENLPPPKVMTMDLLRQRPWSLEAIYDEISTSIQLTAHHALFDAQSLQIILSDVARYYCVGKIPVSKPIEPLLAAILSANNDIEIKRKDFWCSENKIFINRFPDLTPLHETSSRMISSELASKIPLLDIEELCRRRDVSIQVAGQVSWARLLSAYIGESGITFGLTLSGRSVLDGSENVAFPSIVTLPASIDVRGTNKEVLDRTTISNAKLHKNQFTPLSSIQKWTRVTEGKLFDTLFAYQKIMRTENDDKEIWNIADEQANAEYVVSIELQPDHYGRLLLRLTFKESLIPVAQAVLMLRQLDALMADTLQNPQNHAAQTLGISKTLLSITPAAQPILPSTVNLLHEFVSRQAALTPLKTALEFATKFENQGVVSRSWTYQQIETEGNKIANLLISTQAAQGGLIAICFDKCPEASFAILGVLKSGYAYVALDPNAPAERMKFILEDSKSKIILTAGKPAERIRETFGGLSNGTFFPQIIDLDNLETFKNCGGSPPSLSKAIDPQDTCYCLYTSGTTGTPKGCEITHENAVQAMLSFTHLFAGHWNPQSKWLQFASFHFDVSVLEQFWSWSVGICVVSAPRDLIFEDIPGAIKLLGITHIDLTPSLARLVHPESVPSLHDGVFITGGEQLKQEILDVWGKYGCIYNGYGPTEATIGVTMYPRVPRNGKPSNIGPQFLNVGSFVLKPGTEEPVLRGGLGELCVSGKLVGKGYLNRPDLTMERFPNLKNIGERVYRTGDLVRILHDGSFLFLGRADDQVKLRGQRLELTEINEVIKKNVEGLDEVVTLVLKHIKQQKEQLVTFFVVSKAKHNVPEVSPAECLKECAGRMRNVCKARLPGYMVPTHFIALKTLPLSANNKADSKQLASYFNELDVEDLQKLSAESLNTRDWTTAELGVVSVLAQFLTMDVKDIKSTANIFELGIDSISVIGLARSLQKAGYAAKLPVVMSNPSIESLAKVLNVPRSADENQIALQIVSTQRVAAFAHQHMVSVAEELNIDSSMIETMAPCTPAQGGMIYRFLDSDKSLYFSHFDFELNTSVDEERLRLAWSKVASKLQILRTKFVLTADGCAQVVLKSIELPWIRKFKNKELAQDFHTANEHFFYAKIAKSTALVEPYIITILNRRDGRILTLSIFHGLYDGISLPMIFEKVHCEYHQLGEIDYGPSFHSVLPFGPLAAVDGAETFWKQVLASSTFTPMPLLDENPNVRSTLLSVTVRDLGHLEPLRKQLGVTYQAILQAVWSVVINSYISANVTYGIVISGRTIDFDGAERVIGPLLNTIAYQINMTPGMTWKELIQAVHELNAAVLPYQHTPLKDVQRWVGHPLFDTIFVFQRELVTDMGAETLWEPLIGSPVADYPLAFEANLKRNGDIEVTLVGQGSYLNEGVASELVRQVENGLHALRSPNKTVPLPEILVERNINIRHFEGSTTNALPNGVPKGEFVWTASANIIQSEISSLANIEACSVNPHTPIFSLGLDSIDVIKLAARLKNRGINIAVGDIIKSQTTSNMVSRISDIKPSSVITTPSLQEYEGILTSYLRQNGKLDDDIIAILPATPLQEGMVAEMISSGYKRYFNHEVFRVVDGIAIDQLKKSWDKVIQKFDILRTQFVEVADAKLPFNLAQVIRRPGSTVWQEVSLAYDATLEAEIEKIFHDAVDSAARGNLIQLTSLTHGQDQYYILSISHALYDGWSLQALHGDVRKAYHGNAISRPDHRSTLEQIIDTDSKDATMFWRSSFQGLSRSTFPHSSQFASQVVHRYERRSRHELPKLQTFCRNTNISLQTLGQATWALLLAYYLKNLDVIFGVVLSCRDTEEATEVMFPLMNTVAVRAVVHGTLDEMLHYMQDNSNSMRPYQHFPLRKAQALSACQGSLFDTLFIYQGRPREVGLHDQQLYASMQSKSDVEFAICLEMEVAGEELIWRTACKGSVRSRDETEELIDRLDAVLGRIIEDSKTQTIISHPDGISVCGLPSFSLASQQSEGNGRNTSEGPVINDQRWTPVELTIRKVLSQVSKVPENDISEYQTIFHLGLDSISAIKVSSLLRRENIRLSVNDIVKADSLRDMVNYVMMVKSESEKSLDVERVLKTAMRGIDQGALLKASGIKEDNVERILPVTAGQLYMLERYLASAGTEFFASFKYTISSDLDPQRLDRAWKLLLQRHSILRTAFLETGEEEMPIAQVILRETNNAVKWAPSSPSANIGDPLLELVGLRVESQRDGYEMSLNIHHALYDAMSLPLLLSDLEALYSSPNGTVSHQQSSFVDLIARTLLSTPLRREFWKSYLDNVPTYNRPTAVSPTSGQRIEIFHPSLPAKNLASTAQKLGLSIDSLLLAAIAQCHQSVVSPQSNADSAILGVYLSSRHLSTTNLSALSSPTLNLLPLRINHPMSRAIVDTARNAQKDLSDLNRVEIIGTSLREIWELTGTKVDLWINILKDGVGEDEKRGQQGESRIFKPRAAMRRARAQVVDVGTAFAEEAADRALLRKSSEAYIPAIDIEMRVVGGGTAVDLGVFAPVGLLDIASGERFVECVRDRLQDLLGG